MGERESTDRADNEVPRRTDLNPFRDYPACPSVKTSNVRDHSTSFQTTRGTESSPSQPVEDLMARRTEFVNAYNSADLSEGVRQTLHAEIMLIDSILESSRQRQAAQRAGFDEAGRGLGCLLVAGAATLIGYFVADPGESYYLFWGGMAFGAFLFVRGLWRVLSDSGRKWMIAIGGLAILVFAWLNPIGLSSTLTETQEPSEVLDPMRGTITIASTSCASTQEIRITPLDTQGDQDGQVVSLPVTDDEPVPLFNAGCTITFETQVARAHSYEIAVPGVGERKVFYDSIDGPSGPPLRVEITL